MWVGDEYVVRLSNGQFRDAFRHEATVVSLLTGSEVPHARHLAHGDGPDGPWYISEPLPGRTMHEAWPTADLTTHQAIIESLGAALRALHRVAVPAGLLPPWLAADRAGIPLSVAVSAANTNDSYALKPLIRAVPAIKSRRGPRRHKPGKLHADKAYDHTDLRTWVRDRGITVRIARKGIESSTKLGLHRWVIERSIAWLFGYRRLTIRYERYANHFSAFLTLAAAITCYKKLRKAAT